MKIEWRSLFPLIFLFSIHEFLNELKTEKNVGEGKRKTYPNREKRSFQRKFEMFGKSEQFSFPYDVIS